jgi:hypothetical protein
VAGTRNPTDRQSRLDWCVRRIRRQQKSTRQLLSSADNSALASRRSIAGSRGSIRALTPPSGGFPWTIHCRTQHRRPLPRRPTSCRCRSFILTRALTWKPPDGSDARGSQARGSSARCYVSSGMKKVRSVRATRPASTRSRASAVRIVLLHYGRFSPPKHRVTIAASL